MKKSIGVLVVIMLAASVSAALEIFGQPSENLIINIADPPLVVGGNFTNFTELLDTPSSYTGSGGDCVKINLGETALEFGSCSNVTFTDTNASTECTGDEVLLGNESCVSSAGFGGAGDGTGGWTNDSAETNTSLNVNVNDGANVTANWFFGLINFSNIQNVPLFALASDVWTAIAGNRTEIEAEIEANFTLLNNTKLGINEANLTYLNLSGTNANQDINISPFNLELINVLVHGNITQNNYTIMAFSGNDLIGADVFTISFFEDGAYFPHFILQPGGPGQGNVIARSFIIADDNHSILGTTNQTDCETWTNSVGTTLEIDCNTTSADNPLGSGADLLLLGDFQGVGTIKLRDDDGEYHDFNRELQLRDEMFRNVTISGINGTLVNDNLTVRTLDGKGIVVNIDTTENILSSANDSILLTSGTNLTPITNQIFYITPGSPVLKKGTTLDQTVPSVALFIMGENYTYASLIGGTTGNNFIRGVYNRFLDQGPLYQSGFDINATSTELNFSTGTMKVLLDGIDIIENHSTTDLFIEIISNDSFIQRSGLDGINEYGTGEAIGNNRYFNLVCGIVVTHDFTGRMYCVTEDMPSSEHVTALEAEMEQEQVNFFPSDTIVQKGYIPIARVVLQRAGGVNTIQTLSTGNLFFDLRGTSLGIGGSPPTPGITSHPDLSNLDAASSGHTGFIFADGSIPLTANWNAGEFNLTIDWFFGKINYSDVQNTPSTFPFDATNIAFTNETNTFTENQNFSANITQGNINTYWNGSCQITEHLTSGTMDIIC